MSWPLEVAGASNLSFLGNGSSSVILIQKATVNNPISLSFSKFSNITIYGLSFFLSASSGQVNVLYFISGAHVTIRDTAFQNMVYEGKVSVVEHMTNTNTLKSHLGTPRVFCGAVCFSHSVSGNIEIKSSTFVASVISLAELPFINFPSQELVNAVSILIESCKFVCGRVITLNLGSGTLILNDVHADGCRSNLPVAFNIQGISGYCNITNSEIMGYTSAVFVNAGKMLVHIKNCFTA